jgi:hypothetical protein
MHKFFQAGQQELQSNRWVSQHTGDRPSFQADIQRGLFGSGHFQVFAMPAGLLCLEMRHKDYGNLGQNTPNYGAWMMFGAIGGLAAGLAAARDAERYGSALAQRWEAGFDVMEEDELLELARQRRKSFVCKLDEIRSVVINPPSLLSRTLGDGSLAGIITLRDKSMGRVVMEVRDQTHLSVAVDALPRRLGERAKVNVAFDQQTRRFVPRR